jgi:hypothetical protein
MSEKAETLRLQKTVNRDGTSGKHRSFTILQKIK